MSKRTCSIDGCDKPVVGWGWCTKHWQNWRKHGSPYGAPKVPTPDLPGERWLPVVDFERLYEVSDHGRVRSVDRIVPHRTTGTVALRGKLLAQRLNDSGYRTVSLYRNGRHTLRAVHILVAAAFIGPRPEGMEVRHGPEGKLVNTPGNLSYGTPVENARDKIRDGVHYEGSRLPQAKLTEAAVRECRARYAIGGVTMRTLADEFGVGLTTMWHAIHGNGWKHVTT